MTDFSSLQLKVDDLKAKVEQNSITPPYLGAILDAIIELMAAIDISDRKTDISTALSNSQTALSSLNALLPQVSANKSAIDALTPRIGAAEGALSTETSERQTADAALQTALDALRTRVSTNEGNIATNADDIATLQDDLQSVASALNTLSGSGDTTAVIDTFNEVVDFLAGINNNEKLTGKLNELRNLCQDNYEDIGRLKEDVSQITQTVDENRELQNSQAEAIESLQGGLGEAQNELGELSQLLVDYEDDAALKLSEAEMRLGGRIDGVGILPFNSIVEAHDSVIDGAPSYDTQFPSAADGAYRHIIFDKSRRTFLWEIHAGDYPDCPAGDAYTSWKGSEEYVSDGHPRTDRLYRLANELYRWDGTTLRSYSADIAAKQDALTTSDDLMISQDNELSLTDKAKYATFDAQWTAIGGTVVESGKAYECNGTDDLTYDEAIDIYGWHTNAFVADSSYRFVFYPHRALLPVVANNEKTITADRMFYFAKNLKVIKFRNTSGGELPYISLTRPIAAFMRCDALREIITPIRFEASPDSAFSNSDALEEVRIYKLRYNISFVSCSRLSLDSLRYMVTNAANTSAITITVHADVYAKLTGDTTNAAAAALTAEELAQWQQVLADAIAKNISIATV